MMIGTGAPAFPVTWDSAARAEEKVEAANCHSSTLTRTRIQAEDK